MSATQLAAPIRMVELPAALLTASSGSGSCAKGRIMDDNNPLLGNKSETSNTCSTLATSTSMLSMATIVGESESDLSQQQQQQAPIVTTSRLPQHSILRVQTLKDSLKVPDISHSKQRRSVGFDSVEIREYGLILGCNPSVTAGPPTTIEWKSLATSVSSLEDYEKNRPPRRSMLFLKTTKTERSCMLKDDGYTSEELLVVESQVEEIRQSRKDSEFERSDLQAIMAASKRKRQEQKKRLGVFGKLFGRRR